MWYHDVCSTYTIGPAIQLEFRGTRAQVRYRDSDPLAVLEGHTDEVWDIAWSHDGQRLASASKDKSAIIWQQVQDGLNPTRREWAPHLILRDHPYSVGCLAWSKDDATLLTSTGNHIKLWNTRTGLCIRLLDEHSETVTSLAWLPDGTGFISGGLDSKIIHWAADGTVHDNWGVIPIRVTDLAISPDLTRLVTIGMDHHQDILPPSDTLDDPTENNGDTTSPNPGGNGVSAVVTGSNSRINVYGLLTKQAEFSVQLDGELTSVKISQNSHYALINCAPDEIHLWDLRDGRITHRYTGQRQGRHVIRSCFGGADDNFVASGSEDGSVYVWHRETSMLVEALGGHGKGSVSAVAWNPRNELMFASCSDDHTIRIWETLPPDIATRKSSA